MPITLTDAQKQFADSPRGHNLMARARRDHDTRHAYLGRNAPAWTADHEARAIRDIATAEARNDLARAVTDAAAPGALAAASARRVTAQVLRADAIRNSWKGGR